MAQNPDSIMPSPAQFKEHFEGIAPLILEEWPEVAPESLRATEGELNQVIEYVATSTDHTRALIRFQLRELYQIVASEQSQSELSRLSQRLSQLANDHLSESNLKDTVTRLEEQTEELLAQFKKDVLPELNKKVRNNVGGSLLTVLGIGFILGWLFGGGRGR
jgi:hypothetical protein